MNKLLIILFTVSILPSQIYAQISGRVIDSSQELGLPGANVVLLELSKGTSTDVDGDFRLTRIPDGTYTLQVTFLGYRTVVKTIVVANGQSEFQRIVLEDGVLINEEMVVLGDRLKGQARALNQQKNNANITNIVAADQIGRFPDANVGDAMKRIPGITIQVDQGEARFGLIRGTSPRLNSVTVNGERIPSAEAENREVQLDLIPADMIQAIEVNKALTPDMDGDAIGGSVNLITRGAPSGMRVSTTLGSGYNFLRNQPMMIGSLILGDRFFDDKLGVIVSGSYNDHRLGSHNIEAEWDLDNNGNAFVSEFDHRLYLIQRVRRSVSANFDYKINDKNTLFLRSIYNHRDDWENRYRQRFARFDVNADGTATARVRRQTKGGLDNNRIKNTRLEDQRTATLSFSGEHLIGNAAEFDWSVGYARASEERPHERYIRFSSGNTPVTYDLSNPRKPEINVQSNTFGLDNFRFNELTEEFQFTKDTDFTSGFNVLVPLDFSSGESSIKFGGKLKLKEKIRDNEGFEFEPLNAGFDNLGLVPNSDQTVSNYLAGNYRFGNFTTREFLGGLDLNNPALFEKVALLEDFLPGNFNANETVSSGYVMLNQDLSDKLFLLAGLRVENTYNDYEGFQLVLDEAGDLDNSQIIQISDSDSYVNVMPGVHLRYEISSNSVIRAAWTNTIARPNYFSLVPFREVNLEDNELAEGNPDLNPTTSMNLDLMYERYFDTVGILSAGVFYKNIEDFIYNFQTRDFQDPLSGRTFDRYFQPQNGEGGKLYGLEIAVQRQLDFLPAFLKNFGVYANYTLTQSNVDLIRTEDGDVRNDISLPGTAEHTFNSSLSYETSKFNARLSLNYTSDYIDELGDEAFFDRYYDVQTFVDANASYTFTPNIRVFMEANNLTNQPLRFYQGVSSRMMQEEFYNFRFNAGVKIDF